MSSENASATSPGPSHDLTLGVVPSATTRAVTHRSQSRRAPHVGTRWRVFASAALLVASLSASAPATDLPPLPSNPPPPVRPEIRRPGPAPHGVMMLVHGGAWILTGQDLVTAYRPEARIWQRRGWLVYTIDYRPGPWSYHDVQTQFDRLRHRFPRTPICVSGVSSGGQLALLLAAHRHVACTIAQSAPTDLSTLRGWVHDAAARYLFPFGSERRWSPLTYASRIRGPVLLATPRSDPAIAAQQSRLLAPRLRDARLVTLANQRSGRPFTHATVGPSALAHYRRVERNFALRAIASKSRRS